MKKIPLRLKRGAFAFLFPIVTACLSLEEPSPIPRLDDGGHHILFIGNSLTYTNDLPGTVEALAESVGDTIRASMVALPNFALIDHALGMSNAVEVIKSQQWEFVILQQGPTTTAVNRDTLIIATKAFDPVVKASGGRIGELMPWPSSDSPGLFPLVRASFQAAAAAVSGGVFMPAGDAWRLSLERDPSIQLYGPDGYHPGPLGTYLAALVVYEKVTGHDCRLLPARALVGGAAVTTPETVVRFLQGIAHETVASYR